MHTRRASLERLADPRVGPAAADVADPVEVGLADRALPGQGDRGHDLPGLAVAALGDVVVDPGLLHRMQVLADARPEALDGDDLVRLADVRDRDRARVEREAVDVARAGLADA